MPKNFTVEGKIIEETLYYKVIKPNDENDDKVYVFSKYDDTYWTCDKYKLVGPAVLQINGEHKLYWNMINYQPHGQGRSKCYVMEIDSWETKVIDGTERTFVIYHDEKGYKFVRFVDEDGNLYKRKRDLKNENEDGVSI